MTAQPFSYEMTILESHLDTFGHVNNATYLTLFEEARWELITSRGYGLPVIQETQLGPVVLEAKVRFLKELKLRQKIRITCETTSPVDARIATMQQRIERADGSKTGEVCAEAEFKFGLFDLRARKLVPPNAAWMKAISS